MVQEIESVLAAHKVSALPLYALSSPYSTFLLRSGTYATVQHFWKSLSFILSQPFSMLLGSFNENNPHWVTIWKKVNMY